MRLARETDPLPRLLVFPFLAIAALGWVALRLRCEAILGAARCPLRALTGLPCPTCGGTHAAAALARLDLPGAFAASPLVTTTALGLAVWGVAAGLATAVPAWRWRVELSQGESRAARLAVAATLLAGWAFQVVRSRVS